MNVHRELFYLTKQAISQAESEYHDCIQISIGHIRYSKLTSRDQKKYKKYWIKKGWELISVGGDRIGNVYFTLRKIEEKIEYRLDDSVVLAVDVANGNYKDWRSNG